METLTYKLISSGPIMFGKPILSANLRKKADETHEQYEERTWMHKVLRNADGQVCISMWALKNALVSAGSRINMKLSGKSTYTKLFRQGIVPVADMPLFRFDGKHVTLDDIDQEWLFVPVPTNRGSRVSKIFPQLREWQTTATIQTLDPRLTDEIVRPHLVEVGTYIGFGSMRVENGGINGRFAVE